LIYKKPFHNIWEEEKDDRDLRILSERMGVRDRDGKFALGEDEWEACGKFLALPIYPIACDALGSTLTMLRILLGICF
jgi:hypothetical protein